MNRHHKSGRRFLDKYDALKYGWLQYLKLIIVFIIIIFVLFRFFIGFSLVSGNSMEGELHAGQIVMYSRIVPEYRHGDIVCVHMPSGEFYVKRVVGLPGDQIELKNGLLVIDGMYVAEDYTTGNTEPQEGIVTYPYTVQREDLFILGDNREVSIDSRTFGSVNVCQIKGKILFHSLYR